jgi:nicotinamide mononucleotide transporter
MTTHIQRFFGTGAEHRENLVVATLMLGVTIAYEYFSMLVLPEFNFNVYEFIGTWSGLTTVWLCRTENVLCWPWGIVSALSLGYFFGTIGLPGQQWLNWGYFLLIQLWAWPHWVRGGAGKTELSVTTLTFTGRIMTLGAIVILTALVHTLIDVLVPGSVHPLLDAVVVASSIVAQYLLGRKHVESWVLWLGPVNVLSIILFMSAGAYTVMALYIAFFVHSVFALRTWHTSTLTRVI